MRALQIILTAFSLLVAGTTSASEPAVQTQVSFTAGSGNTWDANWTGVAGRTYFAQWSLDLKTWGYVPTVEYGSGPQYCGAETDGEPKFFFRLKYIDADWVTTLQEARDADFDGDGIPNWFEVEELFSDPFDKESNGGDSNSNGLSDGWELFHFGALGIANPNDVLQPDGLTNKEKSELGLDPDVDYSDANATNPSRYTYDGAGRLTGVTAPVAAVAFTLDPEGSILDAE